MTRNRILSMALALAPATVWAQQPAPQDKPQPSPQVQQPQQPAQPSEQLDRSNQMGTPNQPATGAPNAQLSEVDQKFLETAATANLAEIAAGKLALERASSPQVKSYAQKLIDDHTKANEQLKSLADQQGFTLPTEPTAEQKAAADRLSKLSGSAFDRAYLDQSTKDHQMVLEEFKKEASQGKNAALKKYAAQMLPTLKKHHDLAMRDLKTL